MSDRCPEAWSLCHAKSIAQASKEQLHTVAVDLAMRLQNASAEMDPDLLQLPGGSVIAPLLWLYAKGASALRKH
jgi:hypothetical protein